MQRVVCAGVLWWVRELRTPYQEYLELHTVSALGILVAAGVKWRLESRCFNDVLDFDMSVCGLFPPAHVNF